MGVFLCYNIYMLIVSLLSWWYGDGWVNFIHEFSQALRNTIDFFSISSLFKTLFAPFRQISAHGGFLDRLISRFIGSIVRFFLIIFGLIAIILETMIGVIMIILWPLIPLTPAACVFLTMIGAA